MALWICSGCSTAYAVDAPSCPNCGSTDYAEDNVPKISKGEGGESVATNAALDAEVLAAEETAQAAAAETADAEAAEAWHYGEDPGQPDPLEKGDQQGFHYGDEEPAKAGQSADDDGDSKPEPAKAPDAKAPDAKAPDAKAAPAKGTSTTSTTASTTKSTTK